MKKIITATLLLFTVLATARAQDDEDKAIKNMVDSQRYVFVAQTAIPMSGRSRHIDPDYTLKVKKDTITAYLPYYGRAYTAGYSDSDGAIDFKSKNFTYTKQDAKKGGWDITIQPKDAKDNSQKLVLSITSSGSAYVTVTSNKRQNISFSGYIRAPGNK